MSAYTALVRWSREPQGDPGPRYSRRHEWVFDGGVTVPASASPHIVPAPLSAQDAVDPEEAYVAALSSCHMLFFLSLAQQDGLPVAEYVDDAIGFMEKDGGGKLVMTRVELRPRIRFMDGVVADQARIDDIHHRAHEQCFLANSVRTTISVAAPVGNPVDEPA